MKSTIPEKASARQRALMSILVGPLLVLTACSGGVRESQVASAIGDEIEGKTCFTLANKAVPDWPLKIDPGYRSMNEEESQILNAMQKAGYLEITTERSQGWTVYLVTPTQEAKTWWDVKDGYCVGTKVVAEVQEWTEPGDAGGVQVTQVKYTWRLKDVPAWAKRPEFDSIPGMATPVPGETVLHKTNKGWKAASTGD